jgi:hypothetical protein
LSKPVESHGLTAKTSLAGRAGGARWRVLIESQMRRSKLILTFLSDHSVNTGGYFWMEMEIAVSMAERRSREAFVILVKLEECRLAGFRMF